MTPTKLFRTTLVVLVAMGHLAGFQGAPRSAEGVPASTYYCCCAGECHCTGDCCHHGPTRSADPRPPIMRKGAGVPAWQSHQRCGAAAATLQRPPSHSKFVLATDQGHLLGAPKGQRSSALVVDIIPSSTASLSRSSPRAPPAV